ncbi:uncharacterized protein LOC133183660 isoform X2 [Saccostrea echinata]|uniref:uncharacterized protein LOC133183660 isoform X2 n=1 Tax=Saccostrea echinata TaxID=191078 RepID=UPI002A811589|nr:uncharacterized protein LOC133183660 isoform X2 [Saccostrea echinata]
MENSASDVFKCKMCKQGKQTMKRCTRCREVYYCSRECQAKDWPVHRTMCSVTGENSTTGKKWTENSVSVKFTTDDGSIIEQNQTLSEDDGNSSYSPVIDFKKYANNKEPATSNKVNQDSSIKGTFYIENDRIYRNFPVLDKSQEYTDIVVKANRQKQIIGIQKSWDGGGIYRVLSHWLQIPLDKLKVIHKGKILKADNIRECVQKKAIFQVFGEKAEDSSGVDDRDIELMMKQLKVSRNEAILALKEHGDVVDAILGAGQK